MTALALLAAQPGWVWLALAAALLACEAATGSGYLLWPAAAGGVVGALMLAGLPLGAGAQMLLFAALTVVGTAAARRWWPRRLRGAGPDLNDAAVHLVGREGRAVGEARVFVDGKEWAAEVDGPAPAPGGPVHVLAVLGGARLRVRAG